MTSWQHEVHPDDPGERVFARDLLEIEILNASRTKRLFTLYNNHLTSQFVDPTEPDPVEAAAAKAQRRKRQAQKIAEIVEARTRPDSRYVIVGDMNDTPDSDPLSPLIGSGLGLADGLVDPQETRLAKADVRHRQQSHGRIVSRNQASRPATSCSIRSRLARPSHSAKPRPSSSGAPNTRATAQTTTRPGSCSICKEGYPRTKTVRADLSEIDRSHRAHSERLFGAPIRT